EVKKEPIEEDPLIKHSEFPFGPENIIVLSESEDSEVPVPKGVSEAPMDKEQEIHNTEPPSTMDSSVQEASSTPLTSLLEAIV
ncbi:hypothetical protein KI387_018781, partial [Taxus chinensis]